MEAKAGCTSRRVAIASRPSLRRAQKAAEPFTEPQPYPWSRTGFSPATGTPERPEGPSPPSRSPANNATHASHDVRPPAHSAASSLSTSASAASSALVNEYGTAIFGGTRGATDRRSASEGSPSPSPAGGAADSSCSDRSTPTAPHTPAKCSQAEQWNGQLTTRRRSGPGPPPGRRGSAHRGPAPDAHPARPRCRRPPPARRPGARQGLG